ncbi:flavin-containing monooxygenase FMO GS-OX-like 3 isoform X2 [Rhodamnia argentea]|uniref:Flavin-containing monooxygenase n=1 Tax=Rhodamnia argentea TaxID=178133 RepID=A0A8B8PML7_9MYRT|nr:flavin-containing monooxygenase FMO GS-OX-like 3 isoform X2 [Rhodamnia argentea]
MAKLRVKVAVIGAGMSGLIAARELRREGHQVVVFESSNDIGGAWLYDPRVESDALGLDPGRDVVHSSIYRSLRVNSPRQLMGFSDYPFVYKGSGDPRNFPGHEEVLRFLRGFADDFRLIELIQFGHKVVRVEPAVEGRQDQWAVEWQTRCGEAATGMDVFEAVVVCNGKYTQPKIAEFPGRLGWQGEQLHSHNYRVPEPYKDKIVLIIGRGISATDIAKDILPFAREVHQASRETNPQVLTTRKLPGVFQHPMIACAEDDGELVFQDGSSIYADVIIHCTGYRYHFPFLKTKGLVSVDDNRVGPLYKHIFPPSLAPQLSFICIPYLTVTTRLSELQSKWVAKVLSGRLVLPSEEGMMSSVQEHYQHIEELGWPKHHTHRLETEKDEYDKWLTGQFGLPPLEQWREKMAFTLVNILRSSHENWRPTWDVEKWMQEEGLGKQIPGIDLEHQSGYL